MLSKIYLATVLVSTICSLIAFRLHFRSHLRFFSALLVITSITEFFANFMLPVLGLHSNFPIYNMFMLAEYMLIACFFRELVSSAIMKMSIGLFLFCFPFFWAGTTVSVFGVSNWNSYVTMACNPCLPFFCIPAAAFVSGLGGWNSYVVMAGDLFCVCVSARYLYELFTAGDLVDFGRCPEFWISVGVFFYSCCELPITGMLNFWARNFVPVAIQLYSILQVLNIIMYSIFIYAFLCPLKTGTTK